MFLLFFTFQTEFYTCMAYTQSNLHLQVLFSLLKLTHEAIYTFRTTTFLSRSPSPPLLALAVTTFRPLVRGGVFAVPTGPARCFRDHQVGPAHSCIWLSPFPLVTPPPDTRHEATTSRIPQNTHATTTITTCSQVTWLKICFFATVLFSVI